MVPAFYEEIALALEKVFGVQAETVELPCLLSFGTWVGGDMDGSPDVHAKTIRETLARQQQVIVNVYFRETQKLVERLSQSASRIAVSPALAQRVEEYTTLLPGARSATPARHDRMPYRVFLAQIGERLRYTLRRPAERLRQRPAASARTSCSSPTAFVRNKGVNAGYFYIQRFLRRIDTFGFHVATLDVRQHTSVHHQVLAEGTGRSAVAHAHAGRSNAAAGRCALAGHGPARGAGSARQAHARRVRSDSAEPPSLWPRTPSATSS